MKKAFVAEGSKFVIQQLPLENILGSAEEKMKTVDVMIPEALAILYG